MTSAFDQRIIRATIEFDDGITAFENLSIRATGEKFMSGLDTNCQCSIYNMTKEQRNYILSKTSPLNKQRSNIRMTLEVGRQSTGTFILFDGSVWKSAMTQPPDIGIILESYSQTYKATETTHKSLPPYTQLSELASGVAIDLGLTLINQATDKTVGNVSHSGSVARQLQQLNNVGGIIAYVDGASLIIVDEDKPLRGGARILNQSNGMVGIPQTTDVGCTVTMMMDGTIKLGGVVTVQSVENPVANGDYVVEKINYDVANRDQPFWQVLGCRALIYSAGIGG